MARIVTPQYGGFEFDTPSEKIGCLVVLRVPGLNLNGLDVGGIAPGC